MKLFKTRSKRAAVLGCGPSGLFAAHGLIQLGWDVDILSIKRRSEMFGAQYLHAPIPGLKETSTLLTYQLRGSAEEYRRKVYGNAEVGTVSPELFTERQSADLATGYHPAWDIRAAYYDAWSRYRELVRPATLSARYVKELLSGKEYHAIVSSIPAMALCEAGHQFRSTRIWAIGDAPERGIFCPIEVPGADKVICDGTKDVGWYRASNVFDYNTAEWPEDRKPPIPDLGLVLKPTSTNCDCFMDSGIFHRVGRYGTWTKGVLSHQSYEKAKEL